MKIVIIGHSGSGKSTVAQFLGQYYTCPVLHLDSLHFASNWQERSDRAMISDMSVFIAQDQWVMEGNYFNCLYEERMKEADLIIYLNFNRFNCFYRVFRRYLTYKGQTRPDMAENCNEKFDFDFMKWVLCEGRSKERLKKYQDVLKKHPSKTLLLKKSKATQSLYGYP